MGVKAQAELRLKIAGARALINYATDLQDDEYFERSCSTHRDTIQKHTDLLESLIQFRERADSIVAEQKAVILSSRQQLNVDRNLVKVNRLKKLLKERNENFQDR